MSDTLWGGRLRVVLINDTNGPHAGCQLVSAAYHEQFLRVGLELLGTVHKSQRKIDQYPEFVRQADLLVVNGEGSIHHGKRLELVEVATRFPSVLLNCVFEANPPLETLKSFRFIAARESLSAAELSAQGVAVEVIPDVILTSSQLRDFPRGIPTEDLGITDNVLDTGAGFPALVGDGQAAAYLQELTRYRRLCAGRFHAALMAASLGIPFSAWASNTHKTLGLLRDMGIEHLYAETQAEALALAPDILDDSVARYVDAGRRRVDQLFENIHRFA